MKTALYATLLVGALSSTSAFAAINKAAKIDWKPCKQELQEYCTTYVDDHEKHECLEEAPKAKVSKACQAMNSKLEPMFADKHDHDDKKATE